MKIGFLIIATGPYKMYFDELKKSILENFMVNHEKIFFYFTDDTNDLTKEQKDVVQIDMENLGFPKMTLFRYKFFSRHQKLIKKHKPDYLFYLDVDMLIVDKVEDNILPIDNKKLLAVFHPGFYNSKHKQKPHETNQESNFYVPPNKRLVYVAGGFQGGKTDEYLNTAKEIGNLIKDDYSKKIIPVWHDESAWNWYLTKNIKKIKVVTPEYCFPECCNEELQINYDTIKDLKPKILALQKDSKIFKK